MKKNAFVFLAFAAFYLLMAALIGLNTNRPDVESSFKIVMDKQEQAVSGIVEENIELCYPLPIRQCFNEKSPEDFLYNEEAEASPKLKEAEFIAEALNVEEDGEDIVYRLGEKLSKENSLEIPKLENGLFNRLPRLETLNFEDKNEYAAYEEALPHDIVIDEFLEQDHSGEEGYHVYQNQKDIKDIRIGVHHKPFYFGEQPVIAIVIDDMGINHRRTKAISSINAPLTASFLTYCDGLKSQLDASLRAGHEIMVHVPMEPKSKANVAPDVLTVDMDEQTVKSGLKKMLAQFHEIKGINNHMGSRFTEDREKMQYVMDVLKERDLFFLDSKTSPKSVGKTLARANGVDYANRHVFLDNNNDVPYITGQLAIAERVARNNGYAIAIGHPKSKTVEALKLWLPTLSEKNIKLVHLSEIVGVLNNH